MQLAPPSLSIEEIVAVVERCGRLTGILHQATDVEGAALYEGDRSQRGLQLGTQPGPTRRRPRCFNSVSEGRRTP